MLATLDIPTARVFVPLLSPSRYKGAHGGRGSGKSHFFGGALVEEHLLNPGLRSVGIREVQKSIERSSKQLIVDKINQFNLNRMFDVQDQVIKTPGDGLIIFQGMQNHTADSIKSLEGFDRAWVEEAQSISAYSWRLLRPTLRKPGSEIWASWNPASPEDPVDEFFRGAGSDREDMVTVRANWSDNPWFGDGELAVERTEDERARPDEYGHVWEGDYLTISDAIIFRRRVSVEEFKTPSDARLFFGGDWGFSQDPSAFVRCFIQDDSLYIDYEAGGVGIEMDELAAEMRQIPDAERWPWKADGARPETISFLANRYGFKITAAEKWPGSVEDGIARLKAFKRIVVHPRCANVAREFRLYSYKVDKRTEQILPIVLDANNHWIDACIAEGQLVWTARGHIPIEKVVVGDKVMTRAGLKKVLAAVKTDENREVWEVIAGGKSLLATPDHRVFTANRGFVRVDALRYNDDLLVEVDQWQSTNQNPSNITEKLTGAIPKARAELMRYISRGRFLGVSMSAFTLGFTSTTTGLSLRDLRYTTSTKILATIARQTLSPWQRMNMPASMSGARSASGSIENTSTQLGISRKHGIPLRKGLKSIDVLERLLMLPLKVAISRAANAESCSPAKKWETRTNFAATLASLHGGAIQALMTLKRIANSAGRNSKATSTKNNGFAAFRVETVRAGHSIARAVYDLTVDGQPEFFAGGVLVHNCRYALDGIIQNRRKMPKFTANTINKIANQGRAR